MAFDEVNEENVYTCVGHPLRRDIENIVKWVLNDGFKEAYSNIVQVKMAKGLALQDILTEIHAYIHRIELPVSVRLQLLTKMADIEYRLASGASERIQLGALVAVFQNARDLIVQETL